MISQETLNHHLSLHHRRHRHGEILQSHWCSRKTDSGSKKYLCQLADFPGVRPPQAALPLRNYFRSKTWIQRAYMSV